MNSSCFICGVVIRCGENSVHQNNIEDLKSFLVTICQIVNVTCIPAKKWNFLRTLPRETSICCAMCFELLRSVQRVHENISKIERELKTRVREVETLVLKSEQLQLESSLWDSSCFEFRNRIVTRPNKDTPVKEEIKEECDIAENDNEYDFQTDSFIQGNWCTDLVADNASLPIIFETNNVATQNKDVIEPSVLRKQYCCNQTETQIERLPCAEKQNGEELVTRIGEKSETVIQTKWLPRHSKKRKVVVIAEEEELDANRDYSGRGDERCSRAAKKCATDALKCYVSDDNDDNGKDEDYDNDRKGAEDAEQKQPVLTVAKKKKKKYYPPRKKGDPPKLRGKGSYYPFLVIADGDILLYKYGTFVAKTFTHLICKAHKCKFRTEFDYYPSFQVIRQHIDDNHRDRKHRQRISHPCVVCNVLFINQFEFRKHLAEVHKEYLDTKATPAICECCLSHKSIRSIRLHLFSHKNEAEKAYAREIGDGDARCLRPKESEISEKKYVCDRENCTAAFKSSGNLARHKRSHLPVECRSDMTVCSECGIWILKESLDTHIKRIHRPDLVDRVLICPICDKKFLPGARSRLKIHLRHHRGERPFLCTKCGSTFVDNAGLTGHIKQVHNNEEKYPCNFCDKVYTKKMSWTAHVQRRHPENHPTKPSFRKMSKFYYNEELEKALKEEFIGPIQMYPCPLCDVVCKYKQTLQRHVSKHSKINEKVTSNRRRRMKRKSGATSMDSQDVTELIKLDADVHKSEQAEVGEDEKTFVSNDITEKHESMTGQSSSSSENVHHNILFQSNIPNNSQ